MVTMDQSEPERLDRQKAVRKPFEKVGRRFSSLRA